MHALRAALCCTLLLLAAGCNPFSGPPPPAPERRVLVPCPPKAPPVECPALPVLEGEVREDAEGKLWIDAKPGVLARWKLDVDPIHLECWLAESTWRETHAACLADIEAEP